VAMQWVPDGGLEAEKKRTSKEDLVTNIPGRFTGDASPVVVFVQWLVIGVGVKSRRPMLQQEWEDQV